MIKKLVILAGFIVVICGITISADDCKDSNELKYICGPVNSEDILPLGNTEWLITSGLNGHFSNTDVSGHLYLVNRRDKTFETLFPGKNPDFKPDNIRWGDDGMLYTAGDNYVPPEECKNSPCETGWSVISISPETMETRTVTGVDQTATLQNPSVAIPVENKIWIGTYSGDRIGYLHKL
jgi:hypothetical protein